MPVNAVDVHIHMVLKAVSGALQLDGNNNNKVIRKLDISIQIMV